MTPADIVGRVRLTAALAASRLAVTGVRLSRRGGGTAFPGLVALRVDPDMVPKVVRSLDQGVVVVAGTNGKTTTSRLIASMLAASGLRVAHNRSGSNLVRGVAAALASQTSLRGEVDADIAVIEADEAAFAEIVQLTSPRLVVLTNLFRDQLDRYGELNAITAKWKPALDFLDQRATVVVNADDPRLVDVVAATPATRWFFSVDPGSAALDELPHAADRAVCSACGADLHYSVLTVSHLGAWYCSRCGRSRPDSNVTATEIQLNGIDSIDAGLRFGDSTTASIHVEVPGLYTVYNATAAAAAARALKVDIATIVDAATSFKTPFGRLEQVTIEGRTITLALVKNPVAFNETLRMITGGSNGLVLPVLIAINDLDADGRDVSWLWDVDFELLADGDQHTSTTGIRAADMANRLKYAGVDQKRIELLPEDLGAGLSAFIASIDPGGQGFVLATYTAMLGLRKVMVDRGYVRAYWEE